MSTTRTRRLTRVELLRARVRELWTKMSEWQGNDSNTIFLVLDLDNPYNEEYWQAVSLLQAVLRGEGPVNLVGVGVEEVQR